MHISKEDQYFDALCEERRELPLVRWKPRLMLGIVCEALLTIGDLVKTVVCEALLTIGD